MIGSTRTQKVCAIAAAVLTGLLAACASTSSTHRGVKSGFLGDYSQLRPGEKGQAQLLYIAPDASFGKYKSIVMDPVAVYAANEKSSLNTVPKEELQGIINYLDASVREHLKDDYAFVNEAGPDTMRLRIAITEAKGANVALSTASMVVPGGSAINVLQKSVTGASTGVGKAGIEMELLDAQTGQRLIAAMDERAGGKMNSFSKWQAVQEAYDYWAERLQTRLAELRAKP